jgi:acyl-CoA synthetase (NDP forming)
MAGSTAAALARRFLNPSSLAIIGATSQAHKAGGRRWLSALAVRRDARLYPINISAHELNGHKVYRSLRAVPETVDLAAILVPAAHVSQAVEDCAEAGVPAVVMISAGFGETGAEGKAEEAHLAARVRAAGGRMLGPNSAGVFGAGGGVNLLGWEVPPGGIGLVTQSGNMALTFTNYARAKRSGFASILAVGNGADLKLSEAIEMLLADEATRAVLVYCEGFAEGDGRRLTEVLRRAGGVKPLVMLKPGASEAGRQAAYSHTGTLAGNGMIADAALRDAGAIQAEEAEEAFDVALALAVGRRLQGRRVAVLSDGGGHATIVSDCAGQRGLQLASFSAETDRRLREILPIRAGIDNPVDFAGVAESDPSSIPRVLQACLADPGIDGVILAGHFGGYHLMTDHAATRETIAAQEFEAAKACADALRVTSKPFILHSEHAERGLPTLEPFFAAGNPVFSGLESAAKAMAALAIGLPFQTKQTARSGVKIDNTSTRLVLEPEARERLTAAGIAVPRWRVARTEAEAQAAYSALGGPGTSVVLKLVSPQAPHKSDVGGVLLGISSVDAVAAGHRQLLTIARKLGDEHASVLVTGELQAGTECLIGARRDPQFGPVVLFGAGGVMVELVGDVAGGLAPFEQNAALELIKRTKIGCLLAGYRGGGRGNLTAIANLLAAVSRWAAQTPDLLELDLNPVIVTSTGAHIADARMVVGA